VLDCCVLVPRSKTCALETPFDGLGQNQNLRRSPAARPAKVLLEGSLSHANSSFLRRVSRAVPSAPYSPTAFVQCDPTEATRLTSSEKLNFKIIK
jgi:hypothetical protein